MPLAPLNAIDVKVMLAMIGFAEPIKIDVEKLEEVVGEGLTTSAIRNRVHKIKTHAKLYLEGTSTDFNAISNNGSIAKSSPLGGRKRKATTTAEGCEEYDTPFKKASGGKGHSTKKGQADDGAAEASEEDEIGVKEEAEQTED